MDRRTFLAAPLLLLPSVNFAAKNRKLARWSVAPPAFITDPSSATDTAGGRSVLSYTGNGWTAKNQLFSREYANMDWVSTDGARRLQWWGHPSRYWPYYTYNSESSNFSTLAKHGTIWQQINITPGWHKFWRITGADSGTSTELYSTAIYHRGVLIKNAPFRVFGAGVAIDPDSANVWLIAVCGDDPADSGHSSPGTKIYAAPWNDGVPGSWTSALDSYAYTGTNSVSASPPLLREMTQNVSPFHGRGDGLLYKGFRYDSDGVYIFTITITFPTPGDPPSAAITKAGSIAWGANPQPQAIDFVGLTEWRIEDDGSDFVLTDGTTTLEIMERDTVLDSDPVYRLIAADMRAKAFLIEKSIQNESGVTIDREIHVKILDPVFEFQLE